MLNLEFGTEVSLITYGSLQVLLISKQACDLVTALGMDDKKRGTGRRLHLPFWSLASHGSELADRIQGWP